MLQLEQLPTALNTEEDVDAIQGMGTKAKEKVGVVSKSVRIVYESVCRRADACVGGLILISAPRNGALQRAHARLVPCTCSAGCKPVAACDVGQVPVCPQLGVAAIPCAHRHCQVIHTITLPFLFYFLQVKDILEHGVSSRVLAAATNPESKVCVCGTASGGCE